MNALEKYLEENGLSASQFALKAGVSPSTVTRHLQGKRGMSLSMAKVYAGAGVPWDVLLQMEASEVQGECGSHVQQCIST